MGTDLWEHSLGEDNKAMQLVLHLSTFSRFRARTDMSFRKHHHLNVSGRSRKVKRYW